MKKILRALPLFILALIMVCLSAQPAQAAKHTDFTFLPDYYNKPIYNDGYYTYVIESGEAYIVGVDRSISGHVMIPSQLGGYPVAFVYGGSFRSCVNVTEATFPDSVVTIGFNCFENCTALKTVNLGQNVTTFVGRAFAGCTSLTTVNWGPKVQKIGRENFYGCTSLTSITIPDTVTVMERNMFYKCENLETVKLSENLTTIPEALFDSCTKLKSCVIPDSAQEIERYAFEDCSSLESVVIGSNVKSIGIYAFDGCTALTTVTMNEKLENIGNYAFRSCEKLQAIDLPDTVTSIGDYSFQDCKSMTTATLGSSLETIGTSAFKNCGLTEILIPDSVTTIGNSAFNNCDNLKKATIGANVQKIDVYTFQYCSALEEIKIPDSVTYLGQEAFSGCSGAKSLTIGAGITEIRTKTFYNCAGLETVSIGASLLTIGEQAFSGCESLKAFTVAEANPNFSADSSGVLFNKDQTRLIQAPGGISGVYTLPDTVVTVGKWSFYECKKLTGLVFPDSLRTLEGFAFYGCEQLEHVDYGNGLEEATGSMTFAYCDKLTEVNLPSTFKTLAANMYNGCDGLVNVVLPDSVEIIGSYAFSYCLNLKTIDLGNGIREIQAYAFQFCGDLISFTAGEHLSLIADAAFYGCSDLANIYFRGTNLQWCDVEIVNYYPQNYNGKVISANLHFLGEHEHEYSKYVKDNNATCTTNATETSTCQICGATKSREIKNTALGHTGGTATCSSPAICTRCAQPYGYADESKHTGTELVYTQNVGYTYDGFKEYRCDICGNTYITDIVKAKGLPKPVVTAANDAATGRTILNWTHDGESEYYAIYRATSKSGKYSLVDTVECGPWLDSTASVGKTYYYKVKACVEISDYNSSYSSVVSAATKCAAPTLAVSAGSTGKPVLTWNKISGAKKYEIWRSVDGATFKKLTTVTGTSYTDSKATAGTECTYKVKALGSSSSYNGSFSNTDSSIVICAAPSITVKPDSKTGKPALSWKKVTGAKSYAIYRSVNDGEYQQLTTTTSISYKDQTATADNKYSYYVVTLGKAEEFNSLASTVKSITLAVKAPKVSGSANAIGNPVISWSAVENAASYKIYRSTKSSKSYTLLNTTTELSYTDATVTTGKSYYYKVVAVGTNTESVQSSYIKLSGKCAQPELTISVNTSSGKPMLNWNKVTGAKKYEVYRATSLGGKYKKLTTTTKLTYTDTSASVGTTYYYKIRAVGSSSSYNSIYSEILNTYAVCAQPSLTAKVDTATGKPSLSWKKITGASGYAIYRSANGSAFEPLTVVTGTSYKDTSAQVDVTYRYKLVALGKNPSLNSAESAEKAVTATCAQVKLKGKAGSTGKPVISWTAVDGATGYVVYRSTSSSSKSFKTPLDVELIFTGDGVSFTDTTAKKGKTYYYKVVALGETTQSVISSYVKVKSK